MQLIRRGGLKAFSPGTDFTVSFARDLRISAPVVFVGYGISAPEYSYDDYAGIDAAGKIVLAFDHEPQENDARSIFNGTGHTLHAGRSMKIANARRHGAVAVLIASEPLRLHPGLLDPPRHGANQGQPLRASAPTQVLDDQAQIPAFSIADGVLAELLAPLANRPPISNGPSTPPYSRGRPRCPIQRSNCATALRRLGAGLRSMWPD